MVRVRVKEEKKKKKKYVSKRQEIQELTILSQIGAIQKVSNLIFFKTKFHTRVQIMTKLRREMRIQFSFLSVKALILWMGELGKKCFDQTGIYQN